MEYQSIKKCFNNFPTFYVTAWNSVYAFYLLVKAFFNKWSEITLFDLRPRYSRPITFHTIEPSSCLILSLSQFLHIALLACVLRKSDIEILLKVWPQFRLKTRGVVLAASYFVFFSQVSPISYFKCTSLDFKSLRGHSRMKLRRLSLRPLFCHNNFTFYLFHIILRKYRCC